MSNRLIQRVPSVVKHIKPHTMPAPFESAKAALRGTRSYSKWPTPATYTAPAYEVIMPANPKSTLFLTCEHASNALPSPWKWSEKDERLKNMHWAVDIGAEELTRELAADLGCGAIFARFSRLLCDANRPLDSETLARPLADGEVIELNVNAEEEKRRRVQTTYMPYHWELERVLKTLKDEGAVTTVLSIHTYTDNYEGERREVEVGILENDDKMVPVVEQMTQSMRHAGFRTEINQPWSGREGLMYSAYSHAEKQGMAALMLEVRNDLASDAYWRQVFRGDFARAMADAFPLQAQE
eukprot:GFYU01005893.1.p1 GENE.GFYU01005893.1~~GFYU01005893.1.p1  ORF type:complete len:340 (-),score=55.62 GFYU01005893.1:18-908(-)